MKIAIIDSGINIEYMDFRNKSIEGTNFTNEGAADCLEDTNGHGTACAGEMLRVAPDAMLYVIKVLNKNASASLSLVYEALKYCLEDEDIKIINLSCTCNIEDDDVAIVFEELIDRLFEAGKIIVCSVQNNGRKIGYPASFENTISVEHKYLECDKDYIAFNSYEKKCVYSASFRLMPYKHREYIFFRGNSAMTARLSGIIYNILSKEDMSLQQLFSKIESWSIEHHNKPAVNMDELKDVEKLITESLLKVIKQNRSEYSNCSANIVDLLEQLNQKICVDLLEEISKRKGSRMDYKNFTLETFKSKEKLLLNIIRETA